MKNKVNTVPLCIRLHKYRSSRPGNGISSSYRLIFQCILQNDLMKRISLPRDIWQRRRKKITRPGEFTCHDEDAVVNSKQTGGLEVQPTICPRFNGLHKILFKAAKKAMFQVMSKAALSDEELTTTIVGAKGVMNSRAINYQSSNTDDPEPLTPKHFLFNQVGGQFAPESLDNEPYNPRVWWRYVQEIFHQFWKMFERMSFILKSKK